MLISILWNVFFGFERNLSENEAWLLEGNQAYISDKRHQIYAHLIHFWGLKAAGNKHEWTERLMAYLKTLLQKHGLYIMKWQDMWMNWKRCRRKWSWSICLEKFGKPTNMLPDLRAWIRIRLFSNTRQGRSAEREKKEVIHTDYKYFWNALFTISRSSLTLRSVYCRHRNTKSDK